MIEGWNNYLLHLYQNYQVLFAVFAVLFFCAAGVTLEAAARWPFSGRNKE
ncbi:hypothetical protein [Desulfotomaculum copahuensis]|nr:hypothetical protein [Desulfotomaculum copahuensis]